MEFLGFTFCPIEKVMVPTWDLGEPTEESLEDLIRALDTEIDETLEDLGDDS